MQFDRAAGKFAQIGFALPRDQVGLIGGRDGIGVLKAEAGQWLVIRRQERDPHLTLVWQYVIRQVRLKIETQLAARETEGARNHLAVFPLPSLHCHKAVERRRSDADCANTAIAQFQQSLI